MRRPELFELSPEVLGSVRYATHFGALTSLRADGRCWPDPVELAGLGLFLTES